MSHWRTPGYSRLAGLGWPRPTAQCARPLTFTFPASRQPSYPRRHQQAPPRGQAGGEGRASHQPPQVRRSDLGESGDSELSVFDPTSSYGLGGPLAQRLEKHLVYSPPWRPKPMTYTRGHALHHGGCSSAGRRSGAGVGGASSCQGEQKPRACIRCSRSFVCCSRVLP